MPRARLRRLLERRDLHAGRAATATPPPVVAAPECRGKNDKVDVTLDARPWRGVLPRSSRATPDGAPVVVGEVIGSVFADFGLPLDVAQNVRR